MAELQKSLGPWLIWGLGVGYVISGMYFGWNLGLPVGGPFGLLAATVVVTVFYIAFVLGYAELACALPRAGGAFVYASRAFGPHVGFVVGIAQLVEYVLAPPAIAFAIGAYVNQAVPGVRIEIGAVVAYVVFTVINIIGVRLSAAFELVLSVLAMLELCVFGAAVLPSFSWAKFSQDALPHGWSGGVAALPYAIWFYLAIEGIANIAEEAKRPQRDLPIGFLSAMATLVVLTAIVLFGAVGAGGWHDVVYLPNGDKSDSPLPLAISHVVSRDSAWFFALVSIGLVGLVASFHGILIAASRAMLELGRVGYVPRLLGAVATRTSTPIAALLANCVVGVGILLITDTASVLLLSVFGALTLYVASSVALIVLRVREPELPRPYRTPLYPVIPVVALVLALLCTVAVLASYPRIALVYAAIIATAWLGFVILVPRARRSA